MEKAGSRTPIPCPRSQAHSGSLGGRGKQAEAQSPSRHPTGARAGSTAPPSQPHSGSDEVGAGLLLLFSTFILNCLKRYEILPPLPFYSLSAHTAHTNYCLVLSGASAPAPSVLCLSFTLVTCWDPTNSGSSFLVHRLGVQK